MTEEDCLDARGQQWVKERLREISALLGADTVDDAAQALTQKIKRIGLEISLNQLGIITEEDIETIVTHGLNPERVKNNPRVVTLDTARDVLSNGHCP